MWKVLIIGLIISHVVHLSITDYRLQKLEQKDSFTVICDKYKYKEVVHNYIGYDCKVLGGKHAK